MKKQKLLSGWQKSIALLCFTFFCVTLFAQNAIEVKGKVIDETNDALIGVTVSVKGKHEGTITNVDGMYTLKVSDAQATLVFSYIGYQTKEIALNGKTELNVTLVDDTKTLDEIIVVGYGTQKKVNLTGAVQNVKSEDLVKRNASNTTNALQGLVPGVSVVQTSGKPGGDAGGIKIRGTGSINSSTSPLVIIDGVEGDMNYVDMNSVESISVLKDAASASIYGSRASNGVILVTTKRGTDEGVKVSYNGYVGFNRPTKMPEPLNAIEYMEAINQANRNAQANISYPEKLIEEYKTLGADNLNRYDTNWRKLVINDNALTHNNSVSISGGSKQIKFYTNAAHYFQDGNISNNNYKRSTLKLNADAAITKWMDVKIDLGLRDSKVKRPMFDTPEGIIGKALTFVPIFAGLHDDGTWGYGQNGDNPLASTQASGTHETSSPELNLKGTLNLNPMKGWNILTSYGIRRLENKVTSFLTPFDTYEHGVKKVRFPQGDNQRNESWDKTTWGQFNLQSSYNKQLGDHYFYVLAGLQTEELKYNTFSGGTYGNLFVNYPEISHGDPSQATSTGASKQWTMRSFYSRINYNFKEKYLLEFNARVDASSRFLEKERTGFYPSVSGGWRVSEESFFESLRDKVDNLKFRLSYGTLGNQDAIKGGVANYYPYSETISPGYNYYFDERLVSGYALSQPGNPLITWEKSSQLNFGLDASFLNSRLTFTGDYFIRKISDLLQTFDPPLFVGLPPKWENAGDMRNNGWEITVGWRDKIQEVSYSVVANVSDVKNKVTDLRGKSYTPNANTGSYTTEGHPINSIFGYKSDGLYQTREEIDNSATLGAKANVHPGDVKYKDISGPDGSPDGIIDDHDRTIIGDTTPRYEYSLNLGLEWKGFDFSVFFQGVGKRDVIYTGYGSRPFVVGRSAFEYQMDAWSEDNTGAQYPRLMIDGGNNLNNNKVSDFWVKSAAYLRLKNIVVGYTLPKNISTKAGMQNVRLYVSGQNLFTASSSFYKGFDPEVGVEHGGSFYPLMKTFTFGLSVNF